MIDRLVHHAELISLKGDSYRLKDHDLGPRPRQKPPDRSTSIPPPRASERRTARRSPLPNRGNAPKRPCPTDRVAGQPLRSAYALAPRLAANLQQGCTFDRRKGMHCQPTLTLRPRAREAAWVGRPISMCRPQ
jgi:hypothetical protein